MKAVPALKKYPPQEEIAATTNLTIEQAIRFRAFELYQQRGMQDGRALEDWLQAEEEVKASTVREKQQAAAA
jgi:hypothetical protein